MISINGVSYQGNNITITNGKVFVDGVELREGESKTINITVNGNLDVLKVDSCQKVMVMGTVNALSTISGDVDISGDVGDSVSTVSGDVECGNIGGSVKTVSGDIKYRR